MNFDHGDDDDDDDIGAGGNDDNGGDADEDYDRGRLIHRRDIN